MVSKEVLWETVLFALFSLFLVYFVSHLETMFYNMIRPIDIPINGIVGIVGFLGVFGFTIMAVLLILRFTNYMKNRKKSGNTF